MNSDELQSSLILCNNTAGNLDLLFTPKQMDGEKREEQIFNRHNEVNGQTPLISVVDCDKLLFSVFSLLQKLGADERPEV